MLDLMRKHARNWLMKIILGIIIVVFVLYFGSAGLFDQAQRIAVIDGKPIVYSDFQREYQNLLEMYRQRFGAALTDEMVKGMGLKQQAFDNLINQEVVLYKAKEMKIRVSEEDVRAFILGNPSFQRNGAFDERIYQSVLRANRMTPEEFERIQERLLTILRVENLIQGVVTVSDEMVYDVYRMQNQKIAIRYLELPVSSMEAKVKATETDLEAYLKANPQQFRIPEQVQVKYLAFRTGDYAAAVTVSEEEVAEAYQRRKAEWTKDGKTQPLSAVRDQIVRDLKQMKGQYIAAGEAKKAHDTIYQNENFDGYAAEKKLTVHRSPLFRIAEPPQEFAGMADLGRVFSRLEKNEMSRVLQGEKGYYLLQLVERKAAYLPPLKEIAGAVAASYRREEAAKRAKAEAEALLARLRKGEPMETLARQRGLEIRETGLFLPGDEIPRLGRSSELAEALLLLSEKAPYPEGVYRIGDAYVVARFKALGSVDKASFESQKKGIADYLLQAKRERLIRSWIEATRASLVKEEVITYERDAKDL